jgi:hypothetical protein
MGDRHQFVGISHSLDLRAKSRHRNHPAQGVTFSAVKRVAINLKAGDRADTQQANRKKCA